MSVPLADALVVAPERPLLTYYDDETGERTELSATALASWAGRTAALLEEGCGLGPGSRTAVLLPPHWQTAAVLLGAWATGVAVSIRLAATAGLPTPGADEPYDATFVSARRLDDWLEDVPAAQHRFVLGLAPGAAALAEVPDGYRDYVTAVGGYAGRPLAYPRTGSAQPATDDGTSYDEWAGLAREIAGAQGIRAGDRLLVDAGNYEHPVYWLLAPLTVGASVVLCAHLDPGAVARRADAERVTRVL